MSAAAPRPSLPAAPPEVPRGTVLASERCENCGNAVAQRFCGACGQKREAPVHALGQFARVATEDLTHADSRLWRTLVALLFKPGRLTAEFLAGRRARYLPPVRLYLVLSVAFFLVASAVQTRFTVLDLDLDTGKDSKLAQAAASTRPPLKSAAGETAEQRADRLCAGSNYDGPWASTLQPLARQGCRKTVMDNGRDLQVEFLHNVPRAMFLFLPLLAGLMMLMYWRPRRYYVEHLLLFVHNHAFVFLVVGLVLLLGKMLPPIPGAGFALFVYFAWYMYRSMRVVYNQGRLLTVSKLMLLACFYLVCAALMLAATSVYSVLML